MRIIPALGALALLAGCATTGPSPEARVTIPSLPPSLSAPCASPVTVPTSDTNQQDVERYWATDRTSLKICAGRHAAVVASWTALQASYAGASR
jgi:hypothetical protein